MRLFISVLLIAQVIVNGRCYAGEKSNINVIDSLIVSSVVEQFKAIISEDTDSLAIDVSQLEWEKSNYLKILIGNLATEKSFKVFRNYNLTSSFQGLVLTINQFTTGVYYSKPFEKSFLGKNFVTRQIETELRGQFYSARTEEVIKVLDKKAIYADDILYGIIAEIENSNYSFTKGKRESYSFWEKIYEPVLVIASVAVVVYLFFSQRT
jgi:hypothetical protein